MAVGRGNYLHSACVYIYIYLYTHMFYIYVHVYIETHYIYILYISINILIYKLKILSTKRLLFGISFLWQLRHKRCNPWFAAPMGWPSTQLASECSYSCFWRSNAVLQENSTKPTNIIKFWFCTSDTPRY